LLYNLPGLLYKEHHGGEAGASWLSATESLMNSSAKVTEVAAELESVGFHVFHDFLDREQVEAARQEINRWFEVDLKERKESDASNAWHSGTAGTSILTEPTHIMLDAYARSPILDQMVEKILSDPLTSGVLKELAGEHIKFRGYNVQRMTGAPDPRPSIGVAANPHEWHRDSLGEFGIALFLEDVLGPDNGATSLVPGSHYYPYCPRWNCLLGPPYQTKDRNLGLQSFLRFNIANRLLGRSIVKKATGAYGRQGDVYFFINDVWHGREPNTHGRSGIKVMIGAFPADDPFPDKVVPPDEATLAKLSPLVRKAAGQYPAPASAGDTILKRLRVHRRQTRPALIFRLAQLERKLADAVSWVVIRAVKWLYATIGPWVGRGPRAAGATAKAS
jgi:ectoine hydroxylase-related dioxygenase (phytanoyl-CoA dioxygenase family)